MSNLGDRQIQNDEVRQYNDASGNTYTNVSRTTETVNNSTSGRENNSYTDGYIHGQVTGQHQEDILVQRDNNNAARGLIIGILLASITALTVGTIWLFNQNNEAPTQVIPPVIVPNSKPDEKPSPQPQQPAQKETIIERTRDVLVPVPQPQAPSPTPKQDINITVPNSAPQQPAAEKPPTSQTSPNKPQTGSSKTDSQSQQTDTETTTPSQDTSNQPDTTSNSSSTPAETSNPNSSAQ